MSQERRQYDDERTKTIVKATIEEIFKGLGVYMDRDGIEKFRSDMSFLSGAKKAYGRVRNTAMVALLIPLSTWIGHGVERLQEWWAGN